MMTARTAVRCVRYGLWKAHRAVRDCTMIDWDDVRYFLAVARGGSVRAAAERLGVNHATVLRRIAQLEERLGVHMFEKLPSGYRLTAAGEEVRELANQMEASSHQLETRVFGRDQSVRGLLRVTLAPPLATHLLMPDFADFARLHPDIEMEILSSGELANLTNREADALLVGVPGTELHMLGTLWLLTQGETRKTKRVRLFTEFVSRRLAAYAPLLAGLSVSRD